MHLVTDRFQTERHHSRVLSEVLEVFCAAIQNGLVDTILAILALIVHLKGQAVLLPSRVEHVAER